MFSQCQGRELGNRVLLGKDLVDKDLLLKSMAMPIKVMKKDFLTDPNKSWAISTFLRDIFCVSHAQDPSRRVA